MQWNYHLQEYPFTDIAIVEKNLLNGIYAVTVVSYIFSRALYYIQVWRPYKDAS